MPIAAVIAANTLLQDDLDRLGKKLSDAGLANVHQTWIEPDRAADIVYKGSSDTARSVLQPDLEHFDIILLEPEMRDVKLLISDMDSTMIAAECIDELADYAGIKDKIAAITEQAMRGELDFEQALRGRVGLLKGLSEHAIADCLAHKIKAMSGAKTLVHTLAHHGADTVLVSGGFHQFADIVGADLGFQAVYANQLVIEDGHLTGGLDGTIVDGARKAAILNEQISDQSLDRIQTLSLGDGANDIPMFDQAGLSIAYHAKPAAKAAATGFIAHGDLTHVLYALGIPSAQWTA